MMLKIATAIFLAVGFAQAGEPIPMLQGESTASYQCRAAIIPSARQCVARCDAAYAAGEQADERFECTQACTTRSLQAMGACRAAGGAKLPLASR
jgi:hypothetical protein